jgi:YARHG domain
MTRQLELPVGNIRKGGMNMLRHFISLAIILLLASAPAISHADDSAYYGNGYHVYPMQNSDVQLVAETIVITDNFSFGRTPPVGKGRFTINVDMTFKNQGPDTTLQMGFPVMVDDGGGELVEINAHFRTWVNGKEVKVLRKQGMPNPLKDDWHFSKTVYTYTVSFKKGETKKIKHSYNVSGTEFNTGRWTLRYILRTGALWKGVIEDFSLIYKTHISKAKDIIGFLPREQRSVLKGKELRLFWIFKNFEPKNDFFAIGGATTTNPTFLVRSSVSRDMEAIKPGHGGDTLTSAELRYARNKVFASYGYPFKSPFVRAQFYYPGSPYKESASFSEKKMSKEHLAYVEFLSKREADISKEDEVKRSYLR